MLGLTTTKAVDMFSESLKLHAKQTFEGIEVIMFFCEFKYFSQASKPDFLSVATFLTLKTFLRTRGSLLSWIVPAHHLSSHFPGSRWWQAANGYSAVETSIPSADSRDTGSGRFRLVSGYLAQLYS